MVRLCERPLAETDHLIKMGKTGGKLKTDETNRFADCIMNFEKGDFEVQTFLVELQNPFPPSSLLTVLCS